MNDFANRTYDEVEVGATASASRTLTATDVEALALAAGDVEGFHIEGGPDDRLSAQGAAAIAMVAGLLNRRLPGPGSAIVGSNFHYTGTCYVGDTLTVDRDGDAQARRRPPDRIRVPLRQSIRRRARRRRRNRRGADAPHRVRERLDARSDPAPQRRVREALRALRRARAGHVRRRPSVRPRFAARRARGGAAQPDRSGAGRPRSEDPSGRARRGPGSLAVPDRRRRPQPRRRREGRRDGARRPRRGV